jgi:hypothetical protein
MKTILVDLDGVLADFVRGYSTLAHEEFGTPVLTTMTCSKWNVEHALKLSHMENAHVWGLIKRQVSFWSDLQLLTTFEELDRLKDLDNVLYCTARPPYARRQTRVWLDEFGLYQPCIHVTNKAPLLVALGHGGHAIDDHVSTIQDMQEVCAVLEDTWKPYLMRRPYNSNHVDLPYVNTLGEFLDACK